MEMQDNTPAIDLTRHLAEAASFMRLAMHRVGSDTDAAVDVRYTLAVAEDIVRALEKSASPAGECKVDQIADRLGELYSAGALLRVARAALPGACEARGDVRLALASASGALEAACDTLDALGLASPRS